MEIIKGILFGVGFGVVLLASFFVITTLIALTLQSVFKLNDPEDHKMLAYAAFILTLLIYGGIFIAISSLL